ncbi:MAG: enoyl-CoA hydratase-related protein [Dehalococcoidales bacterium]|nr:enoyl-CoA hydratase-related protein [Dehalococcoidales bacterium]
MSYQHILYEQKDKILRITLNRPEVLNALSNALLGELAAALDRADEDDSVSVVIIKGAGRGFSAGYDIEPGKPGAYGSSPVMMDMAWLTSNDKQITRIWNLKKPVIAQVHGYCVSGGNDIMGQCDIVIAAESAVFMHPQVRRLGLTWMHMAAYHAGLQWAKMLMFTGDPVSGKQAEQIGLVAKAVPEDRLEAEVTTLAERIALVPRELLQLNKAAINAVAEEMGLRNALNIGIQLDTISHTTQAVQDFRRLSEEKGLKAALAANEAPFKKAPKPFQK